MLGGHGPFGLHKGLSVLVSDLIVQATRSWNVQPPNGSSPPPPPPVSVPDDTSRIAVGYQRATKLNREEAGS
jgi:hypothetical protein